jgi:Uncharacterised protein family (UPF0175)
MAFEFLILKIDGIPSICYSENASFCLGQTRTIQGVTMEIELQIPDDIAEDIRKANGQDIARHILEAYVIQAYQQRELSTAQLRRLLGFETRYEFEDFLAAHHVPRNYTLADLEHDRETARLLDR